MLLVLLICLIQLSSQLQTPTAKSDVAYAVASHARVNQPAAAFVGDEACRSCHQQKTATYHKTAHFLTSQTADKNSVIGTCLECHATYFKAEEPIPSGNRYDKTDFVLGIFCERCHGPGREHVARAKSQPVAGSDLAIVNPAKLSQARQYEVCSQCHGGQGVREFVPAFAYVPGQPLANYVDLGPVVSNAVPEVHGTQVVLLEKSLCFQASSNMSCATCDDVHQAESNVTKFSEKCLFCHKPEKCGEFQKLGADIANNCIDCHMPNQESKVLFVDVQGKRVSPKIRSHWIKIYPGLRLLAKNN